MAYVRPLFAWFTCLDVPDAPIILLEVMGRLDHLVEAVYDRFKDRYYPDESMSPIRFVPELTFATIPPS